MPKTKRTVKAKNKTTEKVTKSSLDIKARQEKAVTEITRLLAENNLTLKINHEILIIPKAN